MSTAATPTSSSSTANMSCVVLEEDLEIPLDLRTLEAFRRWALSESCPERGRIDYIVGRIEVSMSPEDLSSHGTPKVEIVRVLANRIKGQNEGELYVDSTRVSSPLAELSAEPDIVYLSHEALKTGRARKIPKVNQAPRRFVEIEGAVDLVVEIISDSSVVKDTRRLPAAYFEAGVKELWLVDARGEDLQFQIHHRGKTEFLPVSTDAEGFQLTEVFHRRYRLVREAHPISDWIYDLQEADC